MLRNPTVELNSGATGDLCAVGTGCGGVILDDEMHPLIRLPCLRAECLLDSRPRLEHTVLQENRGGAYANTGRLSCCCSRAKRNQRDNGMDEAHRGTR